MKTHLIIALSLAMVTVGSQWNSRKTTIAYEESPASQTKSADTFLTTYQLPEVVVTASARKFDQNFNLNTTSMDSELSLDELVKFKPDEPSEENRAEAEAIAVEELEKLQLNELIRFKDPAIEDLVQESDSTRNIEALIRFKAPSIADPIEDPVSITKE